MLKGFMNQMMNNQSQQPQQPQQAAQGNPNMNDMMKMIKGKSPQQIEGMAKTMIQQNGGISAEKMKQFESIAKMFGATDQQINDFKRNL